jgi:hypothetical protein
VHQAHGAPDPLRRHLVDGDRRPRRLRHRPCDERDTQTVRHQIAQPRQARRLERDVWGEARGTGVAVEDRAQPGACGQTDEGIAAQRLDPQARLGSARVAGRGDQHQLVGEHLLGDDIGRDIVGHRTHGQVDPPVGQVVEQRADAARTQAELDIGMPGVERAECAGEVERVERLDRADAHPPDHGAGEASDVSARRVQLREGPPRTGEEQLARMREGDVTGGAGEQRDAQLLLELADLHRDRGLRDVQRLGRPPEAALADDRFEVGELP